MKNFELTPQEDSDTTRWNLQHIPSILDKAVRIRQIREGDPYLCHRVVKDLLSLYQKEIEELRRTQ